MNIVLTGFMGTGKSTVGRLLADRLGCQFLDTDEEIEREAGRSVADIFRLEGEAAFRSREAALARRLSQVEGFIIATGGRLMLDPDNASLLSRNAVVICLTAEPDEIIARLRGDGGKRPLLAAADPAEQVRRLLAERAAGYGQFQQIRTDDKSVNQIVKEVLKCISATSKIER